MANRRTQAIPEPSGDEREEPERWVRRPKTPQVLALRARIVPAAAAGESDVAAAERLGTTLVTVGKRRRRFVAAGRDSLLDGPRSGAPSRTGDAGMEGNSMLRRRPDIAPASACWPRSLPDGRCCGAPAGPKACPGLGK